MGRHQEVLVHAAKLKQLEPGDALAIEFGDDATRTKRIVVVPGEAISFGYGSKGGRSVEGAGGTLRTGA